MKKPKAPEEKLYSIVELAALLKKPAVELGWFLNQAAQKGRDFEVVEQKEKDVWPPRKFMRFRLERVQRLLVADATNRLRGGG